MSTQPIRDYLTKQLSIENNIVTYRSLSRALALNVNIAKNELAEFHATDGQQMAATYLLSGSIQPEPRNASQEDVAMRDDDEDEDDEEIEYTQLLLVGEKDLESAQAQFTRLESIHVYSLSPAVIRDAGLLCTPTDIVRDLDNKKGAAMASAVGKVIAANVTMSSKPYVNPFRGSARVMAAPTRSTADLKKKEEEASKPKDDAAKPKPKATGKLDFSKAKTKPLKEEEKPKPKPAVAQVKTEPPQPKAGPSTKTEESSSKQSAKRKSALQSDSEEEEVATKVKPDAGPSTIAQKVLAFKSGSSKRGVKRKSALLAESDSEEEKAPVAKPAVAPKEKVKQEQEQSSSLRVRKGVVLSDSEDGEDQPKAEPSRSRKGKGKAVSEAEKTLHELMDIDDDADGVTRASRDAPPNTQPQPADGQDVDMNDVEEDVNMSDADAPPKRAPVKRKPKKVVPVGKNGLKKKRVVKSKVHFDDKGYMVTEDVSEYESVDEEEENEVPAKGKGKSKGKGEEKEKPKAVEEKKVKAKAKPVPAPAPEKPKPKPKPSGKSGQQSVADFFGKGKAK